MPEGNGCCKTMLIILLVNMLMVLHSGGQEAQLPAALMDLPSVPESQLHNMTFFNGAFANVEGVAFFFDCLGSDFTWLQAIFTNFPALINFVSKLKCVTGFCPRDFENYGCACRYEMEGLPVDEADSCCFQHRKCYEEALEESCVWDPSKITVDVSCLTKNLTCESEDTCERLLCDCDKAAIDCFVHSRINSSLHNLDVSFCPSLVTETATEKSQTTVFAAELRQMETEHSPLTTVPMAEVTPDVLRDGGLEVFRGADSLPESINLLLQNPELGDVPSESGDLLLQTPEARAELPSEPSDPLLRTPEAREVPSESSDPLVQTPEAREVPSESSDPLLRTPEARAEVPSESSDPLLRTPEARAEVPSESSDLLLRAPETRGDVPPESGDQFLNTPEAGAKDASQADSSVSSYAAPESSGLLLKNPEAGGTDALGSVFATYEESMPSGLTEKAFFPDEATTTAPLPHINSIEPEVVPTSAFSGRSADEVTDNLFKLAYPGEESTTYSTLAPEETLDPEDAFGKVCDRFTFLQMRDNGQVKREMAQLGEMLYCLTDRCPEDFELYGCYCGQEGKGQPTDDLDRCCFSHQCCLEQLKKLGCHPDRNSRSEVLCFDHTPKCIGWTMCEKLLCACDKAAAECMATAPFNESLTFPNKQACQEDKLSCRRGVHERPSSSAGTGSSTSSEEDSSSEEEREAPSALRRQKRATCRLGPNRRAMLLQKR